MGLGMTGRTFTEGEADAREVTERLSQMPRRPLEEPAGGLPRGPSAACLDLLGRYQDAGLQRVLLWPVKDEIEQLERVAAEILEVLLHLHSNVLPREVMDELVAVVAKLIGNRREKNADRHAAAAH